MVGQKEWAECGGVYLLGRGSAIRHVSDDERVNARLHDALR